MMALGQTSDISCCATDFRRNDVQPATCEKSGLGLADVGTGFEQTAIMVGVAVAPGMQGKGLGTMLTASALLAAKASLGARRVIAVVDPDNSAALKTNAQFGMVPANGLGALYVEFAADA